MRPYRKAIQSHLVSGAFFIALFLIFTPFEDGGSMLPKHIAAGVSVAVLTPFMLSKSMRLKVPSVYVLLIGLVVALHTIALRTAPAHFTALIATSFVSAVLLYELSFKWADEFENAITTLLVMNIAVIVLQFLLYHLYSTSIVDFHKLVFGSPSRFSEEYLNIPRFSGLQVEPGTYANYIGCLLGIFIMVVRRNRFIPVIVVAGLLSVLLTNSASAIHFVLVVAAMYCLFRKDEINKPLLFGLACVLAIYFFYSGLYEHLLMRFREREDGSLSLRLIGVNSYLKLSGEDKLIGIGFDLDPCRDCHYQDIGVLFNLYTRGGILVALMCSLLFLRSAIQNGVPFFLLAMALLAGEKMYVYEAPVWLFILYVVSALRRPLAGRDATLRRYTASSHRVPPFGAHVGSHRKN